MGRTGIKRFPGKMKNIYEKYDEQIKSGILEIQTDFSSSSTVYNSDLVITDWSSIALEYSFTTKKPSLFINTPMKVMNPDWRDIGIEPMDLWLRDKIGVSLNTDRLDETQNVVRDLLDRSSDYKAAIIDTMSEMLYNIGNAAETGGSYIIEQIKTKRQ